MNNSLENIGEKFQANVLNAHKININNLMKNDCNAGLAFCHDKVSSMATKQSAA